MTTFTDFLNKTDFGKFQYSDISAVRAVLVLTVAFVIAVYIFFVYRTVMRSAFYSKSFNISMSIIAVVTAGIILAMQSSIVISLGMVGALSIVRFRTAIKDPMDLLFLFWSIGTGIICGAGLFELAAVVAVCVTIGIFILEKFPVRRAPYLLIVNSTKKEIESQVTGVVSEYAKAYRVRSRNLSRGGLDMVVELKTDRETELVERLSAMEDLEEVTLMAHDGEIRG